MTTMSPLICSMLNAVAFPLSLVKKVVRAIIYSPFLFWEAAVICWEGQRGTVWVAAAAFEKSAFSGPVDRRQADSALLLGLCEEVAGLMCGCPNDKSPTVLKSRPGPFFLEASV